LFGGLARASFADTFAAVHADFARRGMLGSSRMRARSAVVPPVS
jgi:hypothetical protein